jgi:hypothetical protein
MYFYIEHWKPRPKWLQLTPEDRGKFLFDVSPAMQGLADAGAELIGYLINEQDANDWQEGGFLRVWKMPEREFAQRIEDALEKAGWREFFEPGPARGEVLTPQVAIPYLVKI